MGRETRATPGCLSARGLRKQAFFWFFAHLLPCAVGQCGLRECPSEALARARSELSDACPVTSTQL